MDAMWDYNMRNGPKKVFQVKKEWSEATANWDTPWTGGGGDFDENSPLSSSSQKDTTVKEWERFDVTETVQEYVNNPSSNHGFLIMFDDNDRRGIMVYSSQCEEANKDKRPKLVINGDGTAIKKSKKMSHPEMTMFFRGNALWLDISEVKVPGTVQVYSVDGRNVLSAEVNSHSGKFIVTDRMTPGAYFIRYDSNNNTIVKKSVVVR